MYLTHRWEAGTEKGLEAMSDEYLYSNTASVAKERLKGLERLEDSATIASLASLEIGPEWYCLELGAGAGSIAAWLSEQVGPAGRVVATDIDTDLLDASRYTVWRHDLQVDQLPVASFDLIHFRHVLIHIPAWKHASTLKSVLRTLKPNGVLLAEESDLHSWRVDPGTPEPLRTGCSDGIEAVLTAYAQRGMDTGLGQRLELMLRAEGFEISSVNRRSWHVTGGSLEARFHEQSMRQLAGSIRSSMPELVAGIEQLATACSDCRLRYDTRTTVSVTCRRSR